MEGPPRGTLSGRIGTALTTLREVAAFLREHVPKQIRFWFLALAIGVAAGFAALFFRKGINALQAWLYGTDDVRMLHSFADTLPWYVILGIPILGGLVVGIILHLFTDDGRVRSVAEVIEGAALNEGRVEVKAGLASALASLITLGSGGSSGREGPVVHLAGVISTWVSDRIRADGITGRDLLGCAVALFALEVVLRHFAIHAFAPIVIASVAGTVINRLEFGGVTEYALPDDTALAFYVELPAFLILGLLSGLVAVILIKAVFWTDEQASRVQDGLRIPRYLRPMFAGAMLGAIAIPFPHIIGVGYETVAAALTGQIGLWDAIVFCAVKVVAVAITIGGRMGGGIFSPSLMVGALFGLAFGIVATGIFPTVSGTQIVYALAGLGAVAAAVLGAPISTTMIVFELTGDWQVGLAVMVAVSMSTALASRMVHQSYFLTILERRNIHLAAGPQAYLLAMFRVGNVMRPLDDPQSPPPEAVAAALEDGLAVAASATLEAALPVFDRTNRTFLPVVWTTAADEPPEVLGTLHHVDALKAYNRALAAKAAEEHS